MVNTSDLLMVSLFPNVSLEWEVTIGSVPCSTDRRDELGIVLTGIGRLLTTEQTVT